MLSSRVIRCNLLLRSLKNEASGQIRFFSDEKMFIIDAKINRRNDWWLVYNLVDVPVIARTKFPINVYVLGVVSRNHILWNTQYLIGWNSYSLISVLSFYCTESLRIYTRLHIDQIAYPIVHRFNYTPTRLYTNPIAHRSDCARSDCIQTFLISHCLRCNFCTAPSG